MIWNGKFWLKQVWPLYNSHVLESEKILGNNKSLQLNPLAAYCHCQSFKSETPFFSVFPQTLLRWSAHARERQNETRNCHSRWESYYSAMKNYLVLGNNINETDRKFFSHRSHKVCEWKNVILITVIILIMGFWDAKWK